jgi:hypothetical protein
MKKNSFSPFSLFPPFHNLLSYQFRFVTFRAFCGYSLTMKFQFNVSR